MAWGGGAGGLLGGCWMTMDTLDTLVFALACLTLVVDWFWFCLLVVWLALWLGQLWLGQSGPPAGFALFCLFVVWGSACLPLVPVSSWCRPACLSVVS